MASFEDLKAKYQSVMQVIKDQQVSVKNLHLQDNKLVIKGVAPSQDAANKVWDEIKRVNPRMNDVAANFPVSASQGFIPDTNVTRAKPSAPADSTATTGMQTYTVKRGDTLSSISQQFYGNPKDYMRIFDANRSRLKNHNIIQVGQELEIPGK